MLSICSPTQNCRVCIMRQLATENQSVDHVYACLKNMLSPLGYVGFEVVAVEICRKIEKVILARRAASWRAVQLTI